MPVLRGPATHPTRAHQKFVIPEGVTLVSTTDLQSRITYCNPAFVAVSGFEREELIGHGLREANKAIAMHR